MSRRKGHIVPSVVAAAMLAVGALFMAGCNKQSKQSGPSGTGPVVVKNNVIIIDTAQYTLVSSSSQLAAGTYVYLYKPSLAAIRHDADLTAGNIIIGTTGEGYLRKITSSTNDAGYITLATTQASLEDVFQQGTVAFNANNGASYTPANTALSSSATNSIVASSGSLTFAGGTAYALQFANGQLASVSISSPEASILEHLALLMSATGAGSFSATDTLHYTAARTIAWADTIPIVITSDVTIVAGVSGNSAGAFSDTFSLASNGGMALTENYTGGAWANSGSFSPNQSLNGTVTPGAAPMTAQCTVTALLRIKLYGQTASQITVPLMLTVNGYHSATTADWNVAAALQNEANVVENAAIFGNIANDNFDLTSPATNYATPYQVQKISGDNQTGMQGNYLAQPLVVRITDNNGHKQAGVPVYFTLASGGGAMSYYTATSDAGGYVYGYWQLGHTSGAQTVTVTARNANGSNIAGAPVTFTAN